MTKAALRFLSKAGPACLAALLAAAPLAHGQAARTSLDVNGEPLNRLPKPLPNGADLPNGWRITPAGRVFATVGDLPTNLAVSPDGRVVAALTSGFLPHGLSVYDAHTHKLIQRIELPATFVGLSWSADGRKLYVSGGNVRFRPDAHTRMLSGDAARDAAPLASVYEFTYSAGRLSEAPAGLFSESIDPKRVWWSGLAELPARHKLYATNRGTGAGPGDVVVFDTRSRQLLARIPVEITPYQAALSADGRRLFVSNWSSASVSVIDTATDTVIATLPVGKNPNDVKLSADGRLFVACADDNAVYVIDTRTLSVVERLLTSLTPLAPEGSTPNALVVDDRRRLLYIANADNNSVAVANIANPTRSKVVGFIPTGWYPSALALGDKGATLFIGTAKGERGHPDIYGPESPLRNKANDLRSAWGSMNANESVHTVQTGSLEVLAVADLAKKLPGWTRQVMGNTPYRDSQLSEARPPKEPSIIPRRVGQSSPIKHVIYIIKENRTYDQVFGDLPQANGDPRLTIFGEKITPNQHALAREYEILDNLYCDGEVSTDGHEWSNGAYATDVMEKTWPPIYAGRSSADYNIKGMIPKSGWLWDAAKRKGLTYRSYGELAIAFEPTSVPEGTEGAEALVGHFADHNLYMAEGDKGVDTEKMQLFLKEFRQFEANYASTDPEKRLPNYTVMHLGNDHTQGTKPGERTPEAMVADNDYAIGQLVEAVSHSRYWPETAIFIIEDDAQDGPDHVDARRTMGLVISPYVKRGIVDSTLYTTSSMLRSMELLLGLAPMSQYDASAMPMYASFGVAPTVTPFTAIPPKVDIHALNSPRAYGAAASAKMDFSSDDRAPMHLLNEIIWKSVKGEGAIMPPPVHRFRPIVDVSEKDDDDDHDRR